MRISFPGVVICLAVLLASTPTRSLGGSELGGFVQINYAARTAGGGSAPAGDFPLADERLQLKAEGFSEDGTSSYSAKVDLFHDAVAGESGVEIREAYFDLLWDTITLRAGRQILTWGVGDLVFLNDTHPKDWVAFFTGRPLQYLKIGTDAVKVGLYPGPLSAELVFAPIFQPDRYPTGERLILADPFPAGVERREERPERSTENVEAAGRFSLYVSAWEIGAYLSRGFHRTPSARLDDPEQPTEAILFYPRLNVYGGSVSGSMLGAVLNLETAYYDSEADRGGSDPAIGNSQVKGLIGASYPLWRDATLGVQGLWEWMLDHEGYRANLPAGTAEREEHRLTATVRFGQLLRHQTLSVNLFAFWGIVDEDGYLIPSIRYLLTDELWAEVGGNIFLGDDEDPMFGALDRNDNVYLTVRRSF